MKGWALLPLVALLGVPATAEYDPLAMLRDAPPGAEPEHTYRVYNAPFEVVPQDATCAGPYDRMVRTTVRIPDLRDVMKETQICFRTERRGSEVIRLIQPCKDVDAHLSEAAATLDEGDSLSLDATIKYCIALWDFHAELTDARLSGTLKGAPFEAPLDLDGVQYELDKRSAITAPPPELPSLGFVTGPHTSTLLGFEVECSPPARTNALEAGKLEMKFEAFFWLSEQSVTKCEGDDCFSLKKVLSAEPSPKVTFALSPSLKLKARCNFAEDDAKG